MEGEPRMTPLYDQALLGVLQHEENIEAFLDVIFGFLYRRTDFYRLMLTQGDRLGFPPGVAERIAQRAFFKFQRLADKDHKRRLQSLQEKLDHKLEVEAVHEVEVSGDLSDMVAHVEEVEIVSEEPGSQHSEEADGDQALDAGAELPEAAMHSEAGNPPCHPVSAALTPVEAEKTEKALEKKAQLSFQDSPDSYNGAVRENYVWSQDFTDLEIKVFVPKTIVRGKQVSIDIQKNSLRVAIREQAEEVVLMEGKLTHTINIESSMWSLEPGKCIQVNLSKVGEYWWNAVLEGEEPIDIDRINKERSMATVDEEEHAVLDRLTFDYHQKMHGRPQSHEMKVHEMLKKGWDAEGSPFKGQKFEPGMFNVPPDAVQF
ncbi:nudC domain-containing protein 3 [Lampetra fluviatilis]